jgi:hypothetical protein
MWFHTKWIFLDTSFFSVRWFFCENNLHLPQKINRTSRGEYKLICYIVSLQTFPSISRRVEEEKHLLKCMFLHILTHVIQTYFVVGAHKYLDDFFSFLISEIFSCFVNIKDFASGKKWVILTSYQLRVNEENYREFKTQNMQSQE